MGQAIAVRTDYTAGEVRRFAQRAKDAAQARRLLAIAAVLDGASREEAVTNQSIIQLKNTSLVSTIAVSELLYQGQLITSATYRPLETYTTVAFIYFAILFPLTLGAQVVERRLQKSN